MLSLPSASTARCGAGGSPWRIDTVSACAAIADDLCRVVRDAPGSEQRAEVRAAIAAMPPIGPPSAAGPISATRIDEREQLAAAHDELVDRVERCAAEGPSDGRPAARRCPRRSSARRGATVRTSNSSRSLLRSLAQPSRIWPVIWSNDASTGRRREQADDGLLRIARAGRPGSRRRIRGTPPCPAGRSR